MTVQTVLGPVPAESLGRVDYHDHLFQVSPLLPGDDLDDEAASSAEAASLRASGFETLLDVTPVGLGRRPEAVARISAATGLTVVASTGLHGATRLASNSLLEAVVCGGWAAEDLLGASVAPPRPAPMPAAPQPLPPADLAALRRLMSSHLGTRRGGDGLALLIVMVFSIATVLTRRFAHVRMTPAMCLGTATAGVFAATQASTLAVSTPDMGFLFAFGAVNLGLGLAFFATGARMIAAAYAALLATFETLLGPVWVWLVHAEVPSGRTLIGGAIVFAALLVHIGLQFRRLSRPQRPGETGIAAPH